MLKVSKQLLGKLNPASVTINTTALKGNFARAAEAFRSLYSKVHPGENLPKRITLKRLAEIALHLIESLDHDGILKKLHKKHFDTLSQARKGGFLGTVAATVLPFIASTFMKYLPNLISGAVSSLGGLGLKKIVSAIGGELPSDSLGGGIIPAYNPNPPPFINNNYVEQRPLEW